MLQKTRYISVNGRLCTACFERRAALPHGIDEVDQLALHRTHGAEVVLALINFLLEIRFEVGIVLPRDEGSAEEYVSQVNIAALRDVPFALD